MSEQESSVHLPVLPEEVIANLGAARGGVFLDLTVGAGGHAEALLHASSPEGIVYGLDKDPEVLEVARARLEPFGKRIVIRRGDFAEAEEIFGDIAGEVDGVLFDLGVSSLQFDRPERGFSIRHDGPLDMRMDPSARETAERFVNEATREKLLFAVKVLGEEPRAKAVVEAIIAERRRRPLVRTSDLASLVEGVYHRRGGRIHPATRTFQGIRMAVNGELESLKKGLAAAFGLLKPGGRMVVISFHSGEDRIVKEFLKSRAKSGGLIQDPPGLIRPSSREVAGNRRSRSARMRVARKAPDPAAGGVSSRAGVEEGGGP